MKNVKKLLKKAIVFAVAASMLVGTPLTASAAGIRGVFSVSDGWDVSGNDSMTGTVTNTDTNTNSGVIKENEPSIIGIVLDKEYVNTVIGKQTETLTATVVIDGDLVSEEKADEIHRQLQNKIKWEVLNPDGKIDGNTNKVLSLIPTTGDRTKVTLNPRQGTKVGEEMIVRAKIDGRYSFSPSGDKLELTTNKTDDYTAEAKVFIKEYTDKLTFDGNPSTEAVDDMPTAYLKHTMDLKDYIVRDPKTANDTITWASTNTSVATVTVDGVVTFKKVGTTKILATGEKCEAATWDVTVDPGVPASKVVIVDSEGTKDSDGNYPAFARNTKAVDLADDDADFGVEVRVFAKVNVAVDDSNAIVTDRDNLVKTGDKYKCKTMEVEEGTNCIIVSKDKKTAEDAKELVITDEIKWLSNKDFATVKADDNDDRSAVVTAKEVGTAKITAKASSGKAGNLTVKVSATLRELKITNEENNLYTGQTLQMTYTAEPKQSKDAVSWSIEKVKINGKVKANPNATINSKGLLTIKPLRQEYDGEKEGEKETKVVVVLKSKKKYTKADAGYTIDEAGYIYDTYEIQLEQSSIRDITVKDDKKTMIAHAVLDGNSVKVNKDLVQKSDNTTVISVPKDRTYTVSAISTVTESKTISSATVETLTMKSSNEKVAEILKRGEDLKIKANAKGTATITISGVRVAENGKASVIKTTFKVSVKQPVKTVTLNKPEVSLNQKDKTVRGETTTLDQTVALKATLGPKGFDTKTQVKWTVVNTKTGESTVVKDSKGNEITKASASVKLTAPKVGDEYKVTARAASGAFATSTIKIVKKTDKVRLKSDSDVLGNKKTIKIGENFSFTPEIKLVGETDFGAAGVDNKEAVDYTVNKKGIVSIIKNDDGTVSVYGLNKGKATITAKTPMGKKITLAVTVENPN